MNAKKLLAPLFALVLGAAVVMPASATDRVAAADDSTRVTVEVVNDNWHDVRVYVIAGSAAYRIGTVNGLGRTRLTVPRALVSGGNDLQLVAQTIGSRRTYYADRLFAYPGDELEFRIGSRLALSYALPRI